jgi:histidinol-phosphatase (PHP family)
MHSSYSTDSDATMEQMVQGAIKKGLQSICFTDHQDRNCYLDGEEYYFDTDEYIREITQIREKYASQIEIRTGVELGLQVQEDAFCKVYPKTQNFDFVIGSIHFIEGKDPYYPEFFDEYESDYDAYRRFFDVTLDNVRHYDDFDTLGHLDFIARYGKEREKAYLENDFQEVTDEILKLLVQKGKGLEVNTAGWKYGLPFPHPHQHVLNRFRELGGEIITVGADAHSPEHIAYDFDRLSEYLKSAGFKYYAVYRNRKPIFQKL